MKKILFIMILATIFIPISQTGASMGEVNVQDKLKSNEIQVMAKHVSNKIDVLNSDILLQPEKIKRTEKIQKNPLKRVKLTKRISSDKRDRLFGLLLLAHGGQR